MTIRRGGKTWYGKYQIRGMFGISPETLMMWRVSDSLRTIKVHGETYYEEQSLRACIARHQGDKR